MMGTSKTRWARRVARWTRRQQVVAVSMTIAVAGALVAQDTKPSAKPDAKAAGQIDAISQQATRLEGELGKFKDSSAEAADVMVKLVDLYHQHGRLFGLIRVAQRFVTSHSTDKRHHDVLLLSLIHI